MESVVKVHAGTSQSAEWASGGPKASSYLPPTPRQHTGCVSNPSLPTISSRRIVLYKPRNCIHLMSFTMSTPSSLH
ncbi:hypothetical protein J6590_063359 [Homalodisca vitripennis]|nr:hypothetical protein J6590_063359 [Homalodisca vitripennis]